MPHKDDSLLSSGPPNLGPPIQATTIATKYKAYILVYGDRSLTPLGTALAADAAAAAAGTDRNTVATESLMRVAEVNRRVTTAPVTPNTHGGFEAEVKRIILVPDTPTVGVFKDDWVMLINRKPLADYTPTTRHATIATIGYYDSGTCRANVLTVATRLDADEEGYRIQVSFAKVLAVASEDPTVANDSTVLSVDGGPFNFYYSDVNAGYDSGVFASSGPYVDGDYTSATYVVHLKNVLNVYERTISLERDSVWN